VKTPEEIANEYAGDALKAELAQEIRDMEKEFMEFTDWVRETCVKLHGGWINRYSNQIKAVPTPTTELFKRWKEMKKMLNAQQNEE